MNLMINFSINNYLHPFIGNYLPPCGKLFPIFSVLLAFLLKLGIIELSPSQ